ncbi:MAG: B12-binding domain-containing radical SAM protein [Chloroflexi bacterium]|nr:B12-binding domain-containing radical SAM protein [Chloroflexota bacterium]
MRIALLQAIREEDASHRAVPPLGLAYLVSWVEKYRPQTEIKVFGNIDEIDGFKPDLIGISSVTENIGRARLAARKAREKMNGVPLLLGGAHISGIPQALPPEFDMGIRGEGEETFIDLIDFMDKGSCEPDSLSGIPGMVVRKDGKVIAGPERKPIEDLDILPFPKREIFGWNRFMYMMTSRGCPYHCIFCSPTKILGKYRYHSPERVISEIRHIISNSNRRYIHFFDDLFISPPKRVKEISSMLAREGIHRRVAFGGHIRADLMNREMAEALSAMNFVSGAFGAESGSDRILKKLKCNTTTVGKNQDTIDLCHIAGIELSLSFVIGTPGETAEDLDATLKFINRNRKKISALEVFILLPYPGTSLWHESLSEGLVSEDMDWDLFYTEPFFSEYRLKDNYLYLNEKVMPRSLFDKYVKLFQELDGEMNRDNLSLYENLEKL